MSVDIKFIPLSFINSTDEILKQIKNTVVFSFLFNQHEETSLDFYIESTQYGYTASASEIGTHRLLRITDINSGNVNWETVPYCDCESEEKYLLKDRDILVARTGGTTGKSFIVLNVPSNAIFASYLIRLRLKDNVNLDFINYFLNSYLFWSQIVEMKSGSAMPNVNAEKLKTLKLPKCSIETQNKIVSTLQSSVDDSEYSTLFQKIISVESVFNNGNNISTELTHQLDLVKKLRQQFLQEAVQGKLIRNEELEMRNTEGVGETGAQLLNRIKAEKVKTGKKEKPLPPIKDDEIPFDIPDNWVWCRLGEIAYITSGSTPSQDAFVEKGIPYLKMYNLRNQKIDFNFKPQYIKEEVHNGQLKRCRAFPGDVLMNIVGPPLGKIAIIPEDLFECNFNQAAVLIRPTFKEMNYFVFWYLNEMSEINAIDTKGVAGQNNISVTQAHNMKIPLPPLSIQAKIVSKVEELMDLCDALEAGIRESKGVNEALLQQVLREALAG